MTARSTCMVGITLYDFDAVLNSRTVLDTDHPHSHPVHHLDVDIFHHAIPLLAGISHYLQPSSTVYCRLCCLYLRPGRARVAVGSDEMARRRGMGCRRGAGPVRLCDGRVRPDRLTVLDPYRHPSLGTRRNGGRQLGLLPVSEIRYTSPVSRSRIQNLFPVLVSVGLRFGRTVPCC